MQSVLQSLHTIPGVIGGLLSDEGGGMVLAHSFPPVFDLASLQGIGASLYDNFEGLREVTGGVRLLDLRFEHGRVIVKTLPNVSLLLLCEQAINLQLLFISINVAAKKLEKMDLRPPLPAASQPAPLQRTVAAAPPAPIRAEGKGLVLKTEILKKTASTFWDSMTDSASVAKDTALEISNHFKIGPFKHLNLYNRATGKSARVPVQVIQYDKDGSYHGKIVVTLALAEQLQISDGDPVIAEAIVGGGMFGWEGI